MPIEDHVHSAGNAHNLQKAIVHALWLVRRLERRSEGISDPIENERTAILFSSIQRYLPPYMEGIFTMTSASRPDGMAKGLSSTWMHYQRALPSDNAYQERHLLRKAFALRRQSAFNSKLSIPHLKQRESSSNVLGYEVYQIHGLTSVKMGVRVAVIVELQRRLRIKADGEVIVHYEYFRRWIATSVRLAMMG